MTKPTSCHYKSVPISHYFLCLVGTMRSESVHFTRGGHSYALCSSTCDHIQHVFMWLRYTVAFLAGSKVRNFSVSQFMVKTIYMKAKLGVTDLPTKIQVVNGKKIGRGQQSLSILVKILNKV